MEYRNLGSKGPEVSVVGFGAWAAGGKSFGPVDDRETVAAIRRSVELGANFIDTAEVYGGGHSEEVVGDALQAVPRDDVFVATKVSPENLSARGIKQAIGRSLQRLRLDYVDLYQLHGPNSAVDVQESMRALDDLVREGKMRYVGVSNFDVPLLKSCLEVRHVDSVQPLLHMLNRGIEDDLLPFCRQMGIGVVVYSPMAKGLLTGKFGSSLAFAEGDVRANDARFQGETFQRNLRIVDCLRPIAERHGKSMAQLAIAWVLSRPGVTVAIVGAKRPSQVEENLGGADWSLTDEDLGEIDDILANTP